MEFLDLNNKKCCGVATSFAEMAVSSEVVLNFSKSFNNFGLGRMLVDVYDLKLN